MIYYSVDKKSSWEPVGSVADVPSNARFYSALDRQGADSECYRGPLYFDLDCEDASVSLTEARYLCNILLHEYGVTPRIWFSGHKGFHLTVPPSAYTEDTGYIEALPKLLGQMASSICKGFTTFDASIYSSGKGRMWRIPGVRHEKSNLAKTELSVSELASLDIDAIKALAKRGRVDTFETNVPLSVKLNELFIVVKAIVYNGIAERSKRSDERAIRFKEDTYIPPCVDNILNNRDIKEYPESNYNNLVMILSTFFSSSPDTCLGMADPFVTGYVTSSSYTSEHLRRAHLERMLQYSKDSGYRFSCNFARSNVNVDCVRCRMVQFASDIMCNPNNFYERVGEKSMTRLSNFVLDPFKIAVDDEEGEIVLSGMYRMENGTEQPFKGLSNAMMKDKKLFSRFIGMERFFGGSDLELAKIGVGLMENYDLEMVRQVSTMGAHFHEGEWFYVDKSGCVDSDMNPSAKIVLSRDTELIPVQAALTTPHVKEVTEDELEQIRLRFWFNDPSVQVPILGWAAACFFRTRLKHIDPTKYTNFPLLVVFGESGSGKTETASIMSRLFGCGTSHFHFTSTTPFVKEKLVGGSNTFPIIFDELKRSLRKDIEPQLAELVRQVYGGVEGGKGLLNQSFRRYKRNAGIALVGEDLFVEKAQIDREIVVQLTSGMSRVYTSNFFYWKEWNISGLGKLLLRKMLSLTDAELMEYITIAEQVVCDSTTLIERQKYNAIIMAAGFIFLCDTINADFSNQLVESLQKVASVTNEVTSEAGDVNTFFAYLQEACMDPDFIESKDPTQRLDGTIMAHDGRTKGRKPKPRLTFKGVQLETDEDGRLTMLLHVSTASTLVQRYKHHTRNFGHAPDRTTLRRLLVASPYFMDERPVRIAGVIAKGVVLHVELMTRNKINLDGFLTLAAEEGVINDRIDGSPAEKLGFFDGSPKSV